jgi:hypothetical protein
VERMKVCGRCELNLPEGEFYRDKSRADGRNTYCKTCISVKARIRYERDPTVIKRCARRAYERNPTRQNASARRSQARRRQGIPPREPLYLAEIPK